MYAVLHMQASLRWYREHQLGHYTDSFQTSTYGAKSFVYGPTSNIVSLDYNITLLTIISTIIYCC